MPSQAWGELRGYGFRSDSPRSTPALFEVADPVPGREDVFAHQLASAPKDHTPRDDDFPRGWTVQNPAGRHPAPEALTCGLCGAIGDEPAHFCAALEVLSSALG